MISAGGLLLYLAVVKKFEPLLIFMGVRAMTDFSALIVNPRILLFGAEAQFGILVYLIYLVLSP
jgi:Na+-transporting methylmalonyl-CoA/oxaloacetate decarboxylase beta subunit